MPAKPIPEGFQQHVVEAWHQLAAGKRPSADSVMRALGGSKATAVAAMQFFWTAYLPDMLSGRGAAEVPTPIAQLAASMWERALKLATDRTIAGVAQERSALESAQAAITAEREALASERLRHKAALADQGALAERRQQQAVDAERRRNDQLLASERRRHEGTEQRSARSIESLRETVDALRSNEGVLKDGLRKAEGLVANLQQQLAMAQSQAAQASSAAEAHSEELQRLRQRYEDAAAGHHEERAQMAGAHATALNQVREDHQRELAAAHDHHEASVLQLKISHDAEITRLKADLARIKKAVGRSGAATEGRRKDSGKVDR